MADQNFQQITLRELKLLFQPLADAAASDDLRRLLFKRLGWDVDKIDGFPIASLNDALTHFSNAFADFDELIDNPPKDLKGLADVLLAIEQIVLAVIDLNNVFTGASAPDGIEVLGKELVDNLTTTYLETYHPVAFHAFYLLTIIDDVPIFATAKNGVIARLPVAQRRTLRLDQIPKLLSDPIGTLKAEYFLTAGLTDPNATADKLFPRLLFFVQQTGATATYGVDPALMVDFGSAGNDIAAHTLTIFRAVPDDGVNSVGFGTGLFLSSDLGVVLRPLGSFDLTETVGRWDLTLHGVVQAEGIAVDSNGITLPEGVSGGVSADLTFKRLPEPDDTGKPLAFLLGSATGTRLSIGDFSVATHGNFAPDSIDYGFDLTVGSGKFVISSGDGDGFISEVFPSELPIEFDLALGWSKKRGLHFSIGAGLDVILPVHVSIAGVLDIDTIELGIRTDGSSVDLLTTATFTAHFGSVLDVIAEQVGLKGNISFPPGGDGNVGPLRFDLGFQLPRGIGVVVHAGPVTGGGFIFLDPQIGRYSGALELSVFGVGVKAFGVIDTIFPDGTKGFSFVIVIVAEFTPIQLGFGFTLLGVGGLIGVHRTVDATALGAVTRSGSLANLLFPTNPVADAPAILQDLSTVFPPVRGHFIVGPMAKLGWGTPTLISADLGILIEFPGPRIGLVGVVRMELPSPDFAILALNLAASGLMDFPAQLFSLDAGLFDSEVAGFPVSGDMAFRLGFGSHAAFLLSVGGFNTGFSAPPKFPALRRVAVDLGVSGNPSITCSGYFALTSNTAQIGARVDLRAGGYGIRLEGWFGFDVMFVFSPFSFTASIDAGVRVSFHGVGIGVTLHGSLSGPTPWHLKGKVCVSVLWWDACLPIDVTFGNRTPAALPELDPWEVSLGEVQDDPRLQVVRLKDALNDVRNWSGSPPPGGFQVVVLAKAATADRTPVDPMGAATLRQRVAPLNRKLEKFGEFAPLNHDHFNVSQVQMDVDGDGIPDDIEYTTVKDKFAPGHFSKLSNAQKLSQESYQDMDAGVSVAPNVVRTGDSGSQTLMYETAFITDGGERVSDPPFKITQEQLLAMLERSASALGGIRRAGTQRYMLPLDRPKKVTLQATTYVVADACDHTVNTTITPTGTTRSEALLALNAHLTNNPQDRARFTIVPKRAA